MADLMQISALNYKKNNKVILHDVNLKVGPGHFIALAGENGAGKTTLMRLIAGVAKCQQGKIAIEGSTDSNKKKSLVSYSDTLNGFGKQETIQDIAEFYNQVYNDFSVKKFKELSKFLDVDPENKLGSLSKGMKERFMIALTLARQVKLYLLDEPFNGIDVMSRKKIIAGLLKWVADDSTVIISSHYIAEITDILDQIVVVKDETVVAHSTAEEINKKSQGDFESYFESFYQEDK